VLLQDRLTLEQVAFILRHFEAFLDGANLALNGRKELTSYPDQSLDVVLERSVPDPPSRLSTLEEGSRFSAF
jgi:hypothetical protein